jgi:hypothetical protein
VALLARDERLRELGVTRAPAGEDRALLVADHVDHERRAG